MLKRIVLFCCISALAGLVSAKTVTVNSGGGANHTTIGAALTDVRTALDGPDIINITGGGPYTESAGIKLTEEDITINGPSAASPATIIVGPTSGSPSATVDDRGIAIFNTAAATGAMTVTLKDLIVIPPTSGAPLRGIYSNNNATGLGSQRMKVVLDNIVVSANNGSNAPLATDSSVNVLSATGFTPFRDDAIFLAGFVELEATGLHSCGNLGDIANNADGLVFNADTGSSCTINGPSDFSYNARCGVQLASDGTHYELNGTTSDTIRIIGNNRFDTGGAGLAIWHDGTSSVNEGSAQVAMSYVVVGDTGDATHAADSISMLFADDNQSFSPQTWDHICVYGGHDDGINVADELFGTAMTITNSTLVNNAVRPITVNYSNVTGTNTGTINISDSVIAGNGLATDGTLFTNQVRSQSTNIQLNLINCGVPTAGPQRLADSGTSASGGSLAVSVSGGTNFDPSFTNISNSLAADFVDVNNSAYGVAGTGATPLSGYGDYTGPTITGARGWTLYQ